MSARKAARAHHVTPQEDINRILIDRASQGKRVVRLKGGDPLLFARGGEEAQALAKAGVRYEIIAGVTAALAASATAAIPLTHRAVASGWFSSPVTRTRARRSTSIGEPSPVSPGTIVVYMALKRIGAVAAELIQQGKERRTPLALGRVGGNQSPEGGSIDAWRVGRRARGATRVSRSGGDR